MQVPFLNEACLSNILTKLNEERLATSIIAIIHLYCYIMYIVSLERIREAHILSTRKVNVIFKSPAQFLKNI